MKLCIPIEVKPQGGVYTFVGNFIAWMKQHGLDYTTDLSSDYDVLFVNSWVVAPNVVRRAKHERASLRVAHRVDGAAVDYGSDPGADRIQARVNMYADVTIFQSAYSKFSTREKFPVIAHEGPVIYNPVDVEQFAPEGERLARQRAGPHVACAAWSVNRRKGTWQIDDLAARYPHVTFVLCGRFEAVRSHPNVVRLGHLTREGMARALRSCDVFLNLSENDPCPNVVLEALASGLPVLFRDSGGVRELVQDCGRAVDDNGFDAALADVLARQTALSQAARARAVAEFSPDRIFPQYLHAMSAAERHALPTAMTTLRLAVSGYPVLPRMRTPDQLAGAISRRAPQVLRSLTGRTSAHRYRIGWATYDSFPGRKRRFSELDSFTGMRVGKVATAIAAEDPELLNELYVPERQYDVVIFQKVMDARAQAEADKIRAYGGRVVFDANVNYYEEWGDYFVDGTRPTGEQRRDVVQMTKTAHHVVADSSYLLAVIKPINEHVTWIPDNVDMTVYSGIREHRDGGPLRLVWSGIGKKAAHLLHIRDVLAKVRDAELVLVADEVPDVMASLSSVIPCRFVRFSERRYAKTLRECDVIISPKRLVNAYEMAHTEYKITLGMAIGLPAVASPQQSYREAIDDRGGGILCATDDEWLTAFDRLRDVRIRRELGARARQTVTERYSTPVVAAAYRSLLQRLLPAPVPVAADHSQT